jgi:hypothetical protein
MGPKIQWDSRAYVSDNKVYCIHVAPDEATVWVRAQKAGRRCVPSRLVGAPME